tara:strand:+ start:941 stop:2698 length:1758 start_codon:yes stop_codon:yes gene_type:complete
MTTSIENILDDFQKNSLDEFENWLQNSKKKRWDDDLRLKSMLYVMHMKKYRFMSELKFGDFTELKVETSFNRSYKSCEKLIKDISQKYKICEFKPDRTTIDIRLKIFKQYELEHYEEWFENTNIKIWTDDLRLKSMLYIMYTKKYIDVHEIENKDYVKMKVVSAFQKTYKTCRNMIEKICEKYNIDMGNGEYKLSKHEIHEQRAKEIDFENAPIYEMNALQVEELNNIKKYISTIPTIVEKLKTDMKSCQLTFSDDSLQLLGVVYVIYKKSSCEILYVGSTKTFKNRKNQHISGFQNNNSNTNDNKLFKYLKDNNLTFSDLEFMIVATSNAEYDFEIFIETAFYDNMKNKHGFNLQNGCRPLKQRYTLDSDSYIYNMINTTTDMLIYVGQTMNIFKRMSDHENNYFCDNDDKKCSTTMSTKLKEMFPGETKWPKDKLKFNLIEICPVFMLNQREMHYISVMNMLEDGLNSQRSVTTTVDHFTCRFCNRSYKNLKTNTEHMKRCQQNPNRKPNSAICEFCKKSFSTNTKLNIHIITCPDNPNRRPPQQFHCHLCETVSTTKSYIYKHLREKHNLTEEQLSEVKKIM